MQLHVRELQTTERFAKELQALDPGLRTKARAALERLLQNPRAKSLRCHTLKGGAKPTIYKIDVDTDKAYQITFILEGHLAVLLRVASHAQIDREPC
jgi:mRNA-degrading endonuclease RelE of RelBE toxin-antitoxin system